MTPTSTSTFPSRLRDATRPHHEAVERSVDLLKSCQSLEAYRRLLGRFLGFYGPAEEKLAPWLEELPALDFARRRKSRLLVEDLRVLGLAPAAIGTFPRCPDFPAIASVPRALGCMYVLEGATLGGQLIAKHVEDALNLDSKTGCAFFRSYGEDVGAMWKLFRQVLVDHAGGEDRQRDIIDSAQDTFTAFERWFLAATL